MPKSNIRKLDDFIPAKKPVKTVTFTLPPESMNKLGELAEAFEISRSATLRAMIDMLHHEEFGE
jgi:predicted transcriptional regulator